MTDIAIDQAYEAHVAKLFEIMCSARATESIEHAVQRFEAGLKIAIECRNAARSVAVGVGA